MERPWERPDALIAMHHLTSVLPELGHVIVRFFQGALNTMTWFSSEFTPGSLISTLTPAKKEEAWARPTNDDNEGGLGWFRVRKCAAPRLTLHSHNAQEQYKANGTTAFIDKLSNEDHRYLMKRAPLEDAWGLEKKRCR